MKQLVFLISIPVILWSQDIPKSSTQYGELIVAKFASAAFPDPQRSAGYTYAGKLYSFDQHYSDSSVAMFIPRGFRKTDTVDLVFHFHGWFNNIDTTIARYQLARQFTESGKNAILIIPQGSRNVPDSYGGKLEEKDGFKKLVLDVVRYLYDLKKIKTQQVGRIILSGHSGGGHVEAFILARGGLTEHVKEVYLFDALYGQTEKVVHWIDTYKGKLITMYTDSGGTKEETKSLMADLDSWKVASRACEDVDCSEAILQQNRFVFLHTMLQHDEVLYAQDAFQKFLQASILDDR